eukprot:TRINITY_DN20964_c0_g1_i1.p1 TRINITY_DN20964_c0_g1~~TRINITY_DN20964_c0_g1_i1.p1  ORF type:complete len:228 (+),score=92.23 TRINITY_DN20964_c0_g1_i1:61-684(+)
MYALGQLLLWAALAVGGAAAAQEEVEVPDAFQIVLETDIVKPAGGRVVVRLNVTAAFAPVGAARLYEMVNDGAWNGAPFYRVDPDFVVQFGIPGVPAVAERWAAPILDDPVEVTNMEGTFSMVHAGADTRAHQVFINLQDNPALDELKYAPLGQVVEGLEDMRRYIYNPTEGRPGGCDQRLLKRLGADWLRSKVPRINAIAKAYVLH